VDVVGWDGFPSRKKRGIRAALKAAGADVISRAGSADWGLVSGYGLDVSDCAEWMKRLTGHSAWDDWTPGEMAARYADAVQSADGEPADADQEWAKLSALAFMRVCTEFAVGLRASY
jgi:hypothetical protein